MAGLVGGTYSTFIRFVCTSAAVAGVCDMMTNEMPIAEKSQPLNSMKDRKYDRGDGFLLSRQAVPYNFLTD